MAQMIIRKYKVKWVKDDSYLVFDIKTNETVHIGDLPSCESWINLTMKGYL